MKRTAPTDLEFVEESSPRPSTRNEKDNFLGIGGNKAKSLPCDGADVNASKGSELWNWRRDMRFLVMICLLDTTTEDLDLRMWKPKPIPPEIFYGEIVDEEWKAILERLRIPIDFAECAL
jgi:hypothetical protein